MAEKHTSNHDWLCLMIPWETFTSADLNLPAHMLQNVREMFDNDECSDVTLICDGKQIKCHGGVLGMYSNVFQKMLTSGFKEAKTREIKFPDIGFAELRKAVCFLYGHDLEIFSSDIVPLLQFADMYDIGVLHTLCCNMLMKHINADNAWHVWFVAHKYNAATLYANAYAFCTQNFDTDCGYPDGFLQAEKEMIIDMFSDAKLKIAAENDVFDAIIDWVMFKQDERANQVQEILDKCIRTDMLSGHEAYRRLHEIGESELSDALKIVLFGFCSDLCGFELKTAALPPRVSSKKAVQLSCCVFAGTKVAVVHFQNHKNELRATNQLTQIFTRRHCVDDAYIVNNRLFVFNQANAKLYHLGMLLQSGAHSQYTHRSCVHKHAAGGSLQLVPVLGGAVMAVQQERDMPSVAVTEMTSTDMWESDYRWLNASTDLPRNLQTLLTVSYGDYLAIFFPEIDEAHVVHTSRGGSMWTYHINFEREPSCTAIASFQNIACLISREYVYIVRLDELVKRRVGNVPSRVRAPAVADDKTLTSAVIYGDHLYVAEAPVTDGKLVLHATDFNTLLQLDLDDNPVWKSHSGKLSDYIMKHIGDMEASVKLFTAKLKNPNFTDYH